jgi:hypothetical protein
MNGKIGGKMVIKGKNLTVVGQDDDDLILMEVTTKGAVREYRLTYFGRLVRIN